MKLTVKVYRVTYIPGDELLAAAGFDPSAPNTPGHAQLMAAIKEKFSPLANRFKIFFNTFVSQKLVVGMEAMSFDIQQPETPQAGLVMTDPMLPQDVDRIDGALESELNRMGIGADFENYEWRVAYETKGN